MTLVSLQVIGSSFWWFYLRRNVYICFERQYSDRFQNITLFVLTVRQMDPFHTFLSYSFKIHFSIISTSELYNLWFILRGCQAKTTVKTQGSSLNLGPCPRKGNKIEMLPWYSGTIYEHSYFCTLHTCHYSLYFILIDIVISIVQTAILLYDHISHSMLIHAA